MFKITIYKIETEQKTGRSWQKLTDREDAEKQYGYVDSEEEIEKEMKIYEQVRQSPINLKKVIDAFNEGK